MTLKQQVHGLVEELADDSPMLVEVRETLRMNRALAEAIADVEAGRTFTSEEFMAKVEERWPRGNWADFDRIMARVPDASPLPGDER